MVFFLQQHENRIPNCTEPHLELVPLKTLVIKIALQKKLKLRKRILVSNKNLRKY